MCNIRIYYDYEWDYSRYTRKHTEKIDDQMAGKKTAKIGWSKTRLQKENIVLDLWKGVVEISNWEEIMEIRLFWSPNQQRNHRYAGLDPFQELFW